MVLLNVNFWLIVLGFKGGPSDLGTKTLTKILNQSVEDAGVAFVKGANERKEFFEKNKQTVIYDKQAGRIRQSTNTLRDELVWGRTPSGDKGWCIIAPIQLYSS